MCSILRKMSFRLPQKNNICCVVVTFHPDQYLPERITQALPQVNHLVVVDNHSNPAAKKMLHDLAGMYLPEIDLIENEQNLGIATALNQGASWALQHGYSWLLTFDQDSIAEPFMVDTFIDVLQTINFKNKVAVVGANYFVNKTSRPLLTGKVSSTPWVERKTVITSGTLMSLDIYNKIGGFRDEFFIDAVDHEYCLRARANGFRVIMVLKPLMKHVVGYDAIHIPVMNLHSFTHSPFRLYFITRNRIFLIREYFLKDPAWSVSRLLLLVCAIPLMIMRTKGKRSTLKHVFLGIFDGLTMNTRRKVYPTGDF